MKRRLVSTNPADNYSVVGEVTVSDSLEISQKVRGAQKVKPIWKELGIKNRVALLKPICDEFTNRQDELANLITKEVGKPILFSRN